MQNYQKIKIPASLNDMPPVVDVAYIAEILKIGYETVRALCQKGIIPATKVGNRYWRITKEDFIDYMQVNKKQH